jgi:hypothetical protein
MLRSIRPKRATAEPVFETGAQTTQPPRKELETNKQTLVLSLRPQASELAQELAEIAAVWTEPPDAIRAGILAMINMPSHDCGSAGWHW